MRYFLLGGLLATLLFVAILAVAKPNLSKHSGGTWSRVSRTR